jgi:hypothetical protein
MTGGREAGAVVAERLGGVVAKTEVAGGLTPESEVGKVSSGLEPSELMTWLVRP